MLQIFDTCKDFCKQHALEDLQNLEEFMKSRLEWSDVNLLHSLLLVLDTQSWYVPSSQGTGTLTQREIPDY